MRYFDDMPYEDISEILGTSVGALKASYHSPRKKYARNSKRRLNLNHDNLSKKRDAEKKQNIR